ncbi:MAG: hypothetical protein GY842_08445 [bacterium]|nr:hypothetical protein [bacterium]
MGKPTPPIAPRQASVDLDLRSQVENLEQRFISLRDQARQAQRLASVGMAAAALAHESRNLITPIVGYAKKALDDDDVELMRKALRIALERCATLSNMSERILGLAVNEAQSFRSVPLLECVEEAVACLCRDVAKDGITMKTDIDPEIVVWADPKQLVQVLFNLLVNARQATVDRGGRITISASLNGEEQVDLRVCDTGSGIPADQLGMIFEPFFTTKNKAEDRSRPGAGLGLAISKDIIEEHRGTISVESEVGKGTTFTITLPSSG